MNFYVQCWTFLEIRRKSVQNFGEKIMMTKSAKFWWLPNLICTSEEEVCESLENAKRSGLGKSPTGEENTELHVLSWNSAKGFLILSETKDFWILKKIKEFSHTVPEYVGNMHKPHATMLASFLSILIFRFASFSRNQDL